MTCARLQDAIITSSERLSAYQLKKVEGLKEQMQQVSEKNKELQDTIKDLTCFSCDKVKAGRSLCGSDACKILCADCLEEDRRRGSCMFCQKQIF